MQYSTVLDRKVSSIEWVLQTVKKKTLKNCAIKQYQNIIHINLEFIRKPGVLYETTGLFGRKVPSTEWGLKTRGF